MSRRRGDANVLDEQVQQLIHSDDNKELFSETKIALCIEKSAEKRFWDRVKLWSSGKNAIEFASIGVGKIQEIEDEGERFTMLYVDDFIDLPAYNLYRKYSFTAAIEDIRKVLESKFSILMIHTHPSGDLEPSPDDKALALIADQINKRPLLHIIVNSKGEKKIFNFLSCWNCPHNPFYKVKGGRKKVGNHSREERGEGLPA